MTTFVLVHGSFHGGWCWQRVASQLEAAGHEVHTPTLTGLGERKHLVSPRTGLDVHVHDVANVLEYRDLSDVVLVGHSYGCMVVTGAAELAVDRLAHVVHLDGFIPEDGQSCWDILPGSGDRWQANAKEMGTDWLCPPPDPAVQYGVTGDDAEWLRENMTPMAIWTHEERIQIPEHRAADLPRTFISCTDYETFQPTAKKARAGDFDYHEIETGHDAMVSAPDEVADILLGVADTVS
ncbi:MAG: alpha/beta fold hydrolase [Halobacteriota archaeon]